MKIKGKFALVTGGAGFIGSHLVERLISEGASVRILDKLSTGEKANVPNSDKVEFLRGDVRNLRHIRAALEDIELVFHEAAQINPVKAVEKPLYDFEVNALGTMNVLKAMSSLDSDAVLLFASSAAVYGETKTVSISEQHSLRPVSPYGASKLAAEILCQTFYRTYGLKTICLRYFNIYGPLQHKYVMFDLLKKLYERQTVLKVLGTGEQMRDFMYISDAINATLLLAQTPTAFGETFNVGSGLGTSISNLATTILQILGLQDKTKIHYTGVSWEGDVPALVADIIKIKELGFRVKVGLKNGLTQLINWFNHSYLRERRDALCE